MSYSLTSLFTKEWPWANGSRRSLQKSDMWANDRIPNLAGNNCYTRRGGRATILSRQRDHVFRPQSCLLLQHYSTIFVVDTPSRHRDLIMFRIFSGLWGSITLSCILIVALSLSRSKKIVACPALLTQVTKLQEILAHFAWPCLFPIKMFTTFH